MKETLFQLTNQQLDEVRRLANICQKTDGYLLPIYPHILLTPRHYPSTCMYYEKNQLLGFAGIYFFYKDAVEITLMVHPEVRRQGIAKQLINNMMPILSMLNLNDVIFSSVPFALKNWFLEKKFAYYESEFEMVRTSKERIDIKEPKLLIQKATHHDLAILNLIDQTCFDDNLADVSRLNQLLEDRQYKIFVGLYDKTIIAKAHIRWLDDMAKLSDIAVIPQHQGKGFGREMIAQCINYALDTQNLPASLDVQTKNATAINLYTKLNFETINQVDFWKISLYKLKHLNQN